MHNVLWVAVINSSAYLESNWPCLELWQLALGFDSLVEVATRAQLHHHEYLVRKFIGFVVLDNIWMIKFLHKPDFWLYVSQSHRVKIWLYYHFYSCFGPIKLTGRHVNFAKRALAKNFTGELPDFLKTFIFVVPGHCHEVIFGWFTTHAYQIRIQLI